MRNQCEKYSVVHDCHQNDCDESWECFIPKITQPDKTGRNMLTERDLDLMQAISKYKVLTTRQIQRMFFDGPNYVYRRLKELQNQGYLDTQNLKYRPGTKASCSGSGVESQCYYLTKKAMDALVECRGEKERRVDKIRMETQKELRLQTEINEWPAYLKEYDIKDWVWLDSRFAKESMLLPKWAKFAGILQQVDTERHYIVWMIGEHEEDFQNQRQVMKEMNEITKGLVHTDMVVMATTWESWQKTYEHLNKIAERQGLPIVSSFHLLHMDDLPTFMNYITGEMGEWMQADLETTFTKADAKERAMRYLAGDKPVAELATGDLIHAQALRRYIDRTQNVGDLIVYYGNSEYLTYCTQDLHAKVRLKKIKPPSYQVQE